MKGSDEIAVPFAPPKADPSCPNQVEYSTKQKVHLLVQAARSVQHCGMMHVPLDTVCFVNVTLSHCQLFAFYNLNV